jgi:hypothetical protein
MAESKSDGGKPTVNPRAAVKKAAKSKTAMTKATADGDAARERRRMPEDSTTLAEIDDRIAIARSNLRELVEQAASYSGASDEERMSRRIAEQEAALERLKKR